MGILQWNARSIPANRDSFLRELYEKPVAVVALCETWFRPGTSYIFPGYALVRLDRFDGKGGVAIMVHNSVRYYPIPLVCSSPNFQAVAVRITIEGVSVSILSVYRVPGYRGFETELRRWLSLVPPPFVLCGDLNAHHVGWGCPYNDGAGLLIMDIVDDFNLSICNTGVSTYVPPQDYRPMALDLTIISPGCIKISDWQVLSDTWGSDHLPIITSFLSRSDIGTGGYLSEGRWNVTRADWGRYQKQLMDCMTEHEADVSPLQKYSNFITNVRKAATGAIPWEAPAVSSHRPRTPWWNDECSTATAERRRALAEYRRSPSFDTFMFYRQTVARCRRTLREAKRMGWRRFCTSLSINRPLSLVWKTVNRFRRIPTPRNLDDTPWIDDFVSLVVPAGVDLPPYTIPVDNIPDWSHFLVRPFTREELNGAIKVSSNTAPGLDDLRYPMLKELPSVAREHLLNLYNLLWMRGPLPSDWTDSVVVPLLKPGKDGSQASSYRILALTSCVVKTLERMVKVRLEWWLEYHGLFPAYQFGFRRGHGCMDSVAMLVMEIYHSFSVRGTTTAAFLDLQRAYDSVSLPYLLNKLQALGIPEVFLYGLSTLLYQRTIYIRSSKGLLGPYTSRTGLAQGAVLSPLLFALYAADIVAAVPRPVQVLLFADDFALFASGKDGFESADAVNRAMGPVTSWLDDNGFTLSVAKTVVVHFTRCRRSPDTSRIFYTNTQLPVRSSARFLGIILDVQLRWAPQIRGLLEWAEKALNIIRYVSGVRWGAHPYTLLLLLRATIRAKLDYGCIFYGAACDSLLSKLQTLYNRGLRLCLGAFRTSPTNALWVEAAEPPLNLRRRMLTDRFAVSRLALQQHPLHSKVSKLRRSLHQDHLQWPPLLDRLIANRRDCTPLYKSDVLPRYEISYSSLMHVVDTHYLDARRGEWVSPGAELLFIHDRWPTATIVYTDGSRLLHPNRVGCAYYCPKHRTHKMFRLPSATSVYTAEVLALIAAVDFLTDLPERHGVVVTDSFSALSSISTWGGGGRLSWVEAALRDRCRLLCSTGRTISFLWVPGHVGIYGNTRADELARQAVEDGSIWNSPLPYSDFFHCFRLSLMREWYTNWMIAARSAGRQYFELQGNIPTRPWFSSVNWSRAIITSLVRLRLGHGNFPAHMYRLGLSNTPLCSCTMMTIGDTDHLLLECPIFHTGRDKFYKSLADRHVAFPVCVRFLLSTHSAAVYAIIAEYLLSSGLRL